ncbi:MAG TPA: hypothetical protein VF211_10675 [Burkholderiales bacterium]
MTHGLVVAAGVIAALGVLLVVAGAVALVRARVVAFALRLLAGLALVLFGTTLGLVSLGMQGYRALTREEVAARLIVAPKAPQRFSATVVFPDGREATFDLAGDEIYVDAHILKWKPFANLLGVHTAYELGRVAGRYRDIAQERSATRTVHSLGRDREIDLFDLRQRYRFLAPLVDAQYGSASFVPVTRPSEFELRVSTTGLLIRRIGEPAR